MSLRRRIEKLEARSGNGVQTIDGFAYLVGPCAEEPRRPEAYRIARGGQTWTRFPEETEDVFKVRVLAKSPPTAGYLRLFVCGPASADGTASGVDSSLP